MPSENGVCQGGCEDEPPTCRAKGCKQKKKEIFTLIKVMVALFNLYVFKCLQDVHVNFMNPSVF